MIAAFRPIPGGEAMKVRIGWEVAIRMNYTHAAIAPIAGSGGAMRLGLNDARVGKAVGSKHEARCSRAPIIRRRMTRCSAACSIPFPVRPCRTRHGLSGKRATARAAGMCPSAKKGGSSSMSLARCTVAGLAGLAPSVWSRSSYAR